MFRASKDKSVTGCFAIIQYVLEFSEKMARSPIHDCALDRIGATSSVQACQDSCNVGQQV